MAVWSLNDRAWAIADDFARRAGELGAEVHQVAGARLIDAGVNMPGSIQAGLLLARVCLADLGTAATAPGAVQDIPLPFITVNVNHPVAACMASQYAGWQIQVGKFFAMGSGPMRAAAGKEELFDQLGAPDFRESVTKAVGVLETSSLPDAPVIEHIAARCGVESGHLILIAARTASLAGGAQVSARSVETAMHKLHELKFPLDRVIGGFGTAPLPPVAESDLDAIGRTNDAVLYGARVTLYVNGDDESLNEVGQNLPSNSSSDYGEPFKSIFKRYDHDFYKIDPMLFSPAQVALQNIQTGKTFSFGSVNEEVMGRSFFS